MSVAIVAVVAAGAGSWLLRGSFLALGAGRVLPASFDRALVHARPAVLSALLASVMAARFGDGGPAGAPPLVAGLVVAALVAWRTRSLPRTLVAGVAVFAAAGWLTGVVGLA
jgi:branched-subunit amino acid transport protein